MDAYPPPTQRKALLRLTEALGSRPSALCRDDCGDPMIAGSRGDIYAVLGVAGVKGPGYQLFHTAETGMAWTYAKKALRFATLTNDGDEEGAWFLSRLPTAKEAEAIRSYLGVPKKRDLSDETLARLRAHGFRPAA
jgi:hypothetical protein